MSTRRQGAAIPASVCTLPRIGREPDADEQTFRDVIVGVILNPSQLNWEDAKCRIDEPNERFASESLPLFRRKQHQPDLDGLQGLAILLDAADSDWATGVYALDPVE